MAFLSSTTVNDDGRLESCIALTQYSQAKSKVTPAVATLSIVKRKSNP